MKTTRDLTFLYQNPNDPQMLVDREIAKQDVETFVAKRKGNNAYLTDAAVLKEALDDYSVLMEKYPLGLKESVYFQLQTTIQDDPVLRTKKSQAETFANDLFVNTQFFGLALGTISKENQDLFLVSPLLAPYAYFLEKIFKTSVFDLSENEEKIVTLLSNPAWNNRTNMSEVFIRREKRTLTSTGKELPLASLLTELSNPKKAIRDEAASHVNAILAEHAEICEHEMNALFNYRYVVDGLRGYTRVDQYALIRDDLDGEVLDALVSAVEKSYPLVHEYYAIKATILGQKQLAYHERIVTALESQHEKEYTFEEGVGIVQNVFESMDPTFAQLLEELFAKGMIDVYPRTGKRGGAFNEGLFSRDGNIILLNWTDKIKDIQTLAHEMGHAINVDLVAKHQNALNFGYGGNCVAEIASTFFESMVTDALLEQAVAEDKRGLLLEKMDNFVSAAQRQIGLYSFERELHETRRSEGHLSKEKMGSIFLKHMHDYMGSGVELTSGSENRRVYVGHFRTYFYNYSYTVGLLLAKALQRLVKENPSAIQDIKKHYLSVGNGASAKTIFANLGIDITKPAIWEQGLQEFADDLALLKTLV